MSRKPSLFALVFSVLLSVPVLASAATREIIPAGTLLHCTVSETNFSAKTAQVGDPLLCHLGPLGSFGHSVFPRGAELGGHLDDAKSPGHFFGKGWMQITFDRMILPGAEILPLEAKIVSSPHTKVDAEGRIRGKGHPTRDAVLWAVPIFWPIKILTLPARGPFPALKGETRLSLRLMEDVEVPFAVAKNVPMPPWASPSAYQPSSYRVFRQASASLVEAPAAPSVTNLPLTRVASPAPVLAAMPPAAVSSAAPQGAEPTLTVLALLSGQAVLARDYWVEGGEVHCLSQNGEQSTIPLDQMDLYQTASLNRQRNVRFVLQSRDIVAQ
jgi:hypothetical protein